MSVIKIATWNVNSIRVRLPRLLQWLETYQPDVMCLQELKCVEEQFPFEALQQAGYHAVALGQKTYNGVAIVSKHPISDVRTDFFPEDTQARFISAHTAGVRVMSVYVPNGADINDPKYDYKQVWYQQLRDYLNRHVQAHEPLAICGDFNVAPRDVDVAQPETWKNSVLCHEKARQAWQHVCDFGLTDVGAHVFPKGGIYSWWNYRMLGFEKNNGLRIDHILVTPSLLAGVRAVFTDRDERRGEQPSDHVPVMATFAL